MLDIVIHLANIKGHVKTVSAAVAGGAVGAVYQIASDPVKIAAFQAGDWTMVKHVALAGAAMAAVGLIVQSPYSPKPPAQPPAVGQ